jgi:toxin HigB-1
MSYVALHATVFSFFFKEGLAGLERSQMIKSFKNKGLAELFQTGKTAKIASEMHERIIRRLDMLDAARSPNDMRAPGLNFHPLNGFDPPRYSIHVNGPWCITFEFETLDAAQVDFEQYH